MISLEVADRTLGRRLELAIDCIPIVFPHGQPALEFGHARTS